MFSVQRSERIREKLTAEGGASLQELAKLLNVSRATVYRDVKHLREEGFLTLTGGRAQLVRSTHAGAFQPDNLQWSSQQKLAQMDSIASMAVSLIEAIDSIFIGESLLCYFLAKKIKLQYNLKNITVVTNNFNVALELYSYIKYIYLIGGEILQNIENFYTGGPKFATNLSHIYVSKSFTSVDGVDLKVGYTMQDLSQLNILSYLPSFSAQSIFLVTSHKFGYRAVHQLAPLDFGHIIITDNALEEKYVHHFHHLKKPRLILAS